MVSIDVAVVTSTSPREMTTHLRRGRNAATLGDDATLGQDDDAHRTSVDASLGEYVDEGK